MNINATFCVNKGTGPSLGYSEDTEDFWFQRTNFQICVASSFKRVTVCWVWLKAATVCLDKASTCNSKSVKVAPWTNMAKGENHQEAFFARCLAFNNIPVTNHWQVGGDSFWEMCASPSTPSNPVIHPLFSRIHR